MLSDHERDQLKAQHKQERDGRVRDRIKAVLLPCFPLVCQPLGDILTLEKRDIIALDVQFLLTPFAKNENLLGWFFFGHLNSHEISIQTHHRRYTYGRFFPLFLRSF